MIQKNFQSVCLLILFLVLGIFVLSGCNRAGSEIIAGESPTASPQQTRVASTQTVPVIVSPDQAYPLPITETAMSPSQVAAPYPAPIDATQSSVSTSAIPMLPSDKNTPINPYPVQETPALQQSGLSTPSPYPPPADTVSMVTSTNTVPVKTLDGVNLVTPFPSITSTPTINPALTPQATIVKTRLVATDPASVSLEAGRPQLVVFFAEWCTLCKSIAPVVLNIEDQYKDRMNFIYLDVDDEGTQSLQKKFNYRIIARPRIYLIDALGVILRDWTGYVPLEELQQAITSYISASPSMVPPTEAPPPTKSP